MPLLWFSFEGGVYHVEIPEKASVADVLPLISTKLGVPLPWWLLSLMKDNKKLPEDSNLGSLSSSLISPAVEVGLPSCPELLVPEAYFNKLIDEWNTIRHLNKTDDSKPKDHASSPLLSVQIFGSIQETPIEDGTVEGLRMRVHKLFVSTEHDHSKEIYLEVNGKELTTVDKRAKSSEVVKVAFLPAPPGALPDMSSRHVDTTVLTVCRLCRHRRKEYLRSVFEKYMPSQVAPPKTKKVRKQQRSEGMWDIFQLDLEPQEEGIEMTPLSRPGCFDFVADA